MHLAIALLGAPQFQVDDVPITPHRRAVVALLAYLIVTDSEHGSQRYLRESLAALLWTDHEQSKALANLRHTLWEINRFIGEGWIQAEHEAVNINPRASVTLDVAQFRSLAGQAKQHPDPTLRISLLLSAANLYRGEFMSGFSLKGASSFHEWMGREAERLQRELSAILASLVSEYTTLQQPLQAVAHAHRLIALDALNEAAHRQLMLLYAQTGATTVALQQYRKLENLLRKELDLDPQPETQALYRRLRKRELQPAPAARRSRQSKQQKARHNLPVLLTTFVGRQREQDEISRLVLQHRLVTLLGVGGIGKTRLALQVGKSLLDHFRDGTWLISCESLATAERVAQTVASALDIVEAPDQTVLQALVSALRNDSRLLIFDNCEHLLEACAQLAEALLKNAPEIHILTTSRESLRLEGEAAYRVPPLTLPKGGEEQRAGEPENGEAVQLFAERASLADPGFRITNENASTVAGICNQLAGIPLAVELAAAHVNLLTVEEISQQLEHSFDLLVNRNRSVSPRHQTLRTSLDWSWNLLTETERTCIRQHSVFMGGWTLPASRAVVAGDTLGLTGVLLKKSLIQAAHQTGSSTRYGMHEVVRAYAYEKLIEAGEEKDVRDRHLGYFLDLCRKLEPVSRDLNQQHWLERLYYERDNLRAALGWAARTNVQAGLYLSGRLRSFWEMCKSRDEARWLLTI